MVNEKVSEFSFLNFRQEKEIYKNFMAESKFPELATIVEELCRPESYSLVVHRANHNMPMPSLTELGQFMYVLRSVLFPGYFGKLEFTPTTLSYYIGAALDQAVHILSEQIRCGYCFACTLSQSECAQCEQRALDTARQFINVIPSIRRLLASDVQAAYEGDPAAKNPGETIYCYPSIHALTYQRVAHQLYRQNVPLIPRIITEMAHSATGIDIHPGAQIGERFFIDHGTGVVIGETCIIGRNVRLYQGVTLGAKSFPVDAQGNLIKGIPRHPIVEDDVTIYAGATILGRITIGKNSVIGGNVWVTKDVPAGTRILQSRHQESYEQGGGI